MEYKYIDITQIKNMTCDHCDLGWYWQGSPPVKKIQPCHSGSMICDRISLTPGSPVRTSRGYHEQAEKELKRYITEHGELELNSEIGRVRLNAHQPL